MFYYAPSQGCIFEQRDPSVCLSRGAAAQAIGTLAACSLATAGHRRCADCGPVRGRTQIRRDFWIELPSQRGGGISSRRPRGDIAKFHYTTPTGPDPTGQSADFVWSGRVRSGPSSGIQRIPCWWLITLSSPSSCFPFPTFPPTLLPLPNFTLIFMSRQNVRTNGF